ncbi:hypothetical protein [Thermomonospora echinospora]|uniref:hypothetical protein n=1 Tax=Thermomonospora echinospora TaxID=1992 RepID=UPI000CDF2B36|nr:hypothetical protein [Thermomonospora echinospora]
MVAVLLLGLALTHLELLSEGFRHAHYLGVQMITGALLESAAAVAVIADDRTWIWGFALAEGALNALGYLLSRAFGLPLTAAGVAGDWLHTGALALGFLGLTVTGLASWVLLGRHLHTRRGPVTSARDRALLPVSPPKRPEE